MSRLDYFLLSPTGNTTVLVKTPVPRAAQGEAALFLLKETGAEQVGFIEPAALAGARARLQMAGGEFCGNAAMSLAALLAREEGLPSGVETPVFLESSSTCELVRCDVCLMDDTHFSGMLRFPLPTAISRRALPMQGESLELWTVSFPGITHVMLPAETARRFSGGPKTLAEAVIKPWAKALGADALGIMLLDEARLTMTPLVYVAEPETLCWETGCGSGTAAVVAYLALTGGRSGAFPVNQPGGVITARADLEKGDLRGLSITGEIVLLAESSIQIDSLL